MLHQAGVFNYHCMMHGTTKLKFIEAKQAKDFFKFKNTKRKLYKVNSAIWYNKICRQRRLTPNYINIKINGTNKQCQRTKKAAITYRLNQVIKYLHHKKQLINQQLYHLHLNCANTWNNLWSILDHIIEDSLQHEMEAHYKNLNKKLDNLQSQQRKEYKRNTGHQFYKRTVNLIAIEFNQEEMELLNTGIQHSIEQPMKQYWNDLIIEAEQAIRKLEPKSQEAYILIATKKLKQIKHFQNHNNIYAKRQSHIADNIKQKLQIGKAMITRADKGRTTVIITIEEYNSKTLDFIHNNNFNYLTQIPLLNFKKT